jgi:Neutral/alkaline non-lysosomal ceramidase, N-terminal
VIGLRFECTHPHSSSLSRTLLFSLCSPGSLFLRVSRCSRSAYSYPFNVNATDYEYDVDKNTTLIRVQKEDGTDVGVLQWFSVHGTSMNNTNSLISGDNKGFASWALERMHNPPSSMPGTGPFVAAFAQSNEGDVSPNTVYDSRVLGCCLVAVVALVVVVY